MTRNDAEKLHLATLLKTLCESELADDPMICHDGGYRFSGDFMSMEIDLSPAAILDDAIYQQLLREGYIEELDPSVGRSGGFRVTERGREVAFTS